MMSCPSVSRPFACFIWCPVKGRSALCLPLAEGPSDAVAGTGGRETTPQSASNTTPFSLNLRLLRDRTEGGGDVR